MRNTKMNKLKLTIGGLIIVAMFTGCIANHGWIGHGIMTNVQLAGNNYKIVSTVTGEASAEYILLTGQTKQTLWGQALRNMINQANLVGSSGRAIINVTTDVEIEYIISPYIWHRTTVYATGDVIEFQ